MGWIRAADLSPNCRFAGPPRFYVAAFILGRRPLHPVDRGYRTAAIGTLNAYREVA